MGEAEGAKLLSLYCCRLEWRTAKGALFPQVYWLVGKPMLESGIVIGWILHGQYVFALDTLPRKDFKQSKEKASSACSHTVPQLSTSPARLASPLGTFKRVACSTQTLFSLDSVYPGFQLTSPELEGPCLCCELLLFAGTRQQYGFFLHRWGRATPWDLLVEAVFTDTFDFGGFYAHWTKAMWITNCSCSGCCKGNPGSVSKILLCLVSKSAFPWCTSLRLELSALPLDFVSGLKLSGWLSLFHFLTFSNYQICP